MSTAWSERLEVVRGARVVAAGTLEELVALAREGQLRPGDRVAGLAPGEPVPLHAIPPLGTLVPTPAEARVARTARALLVVDGVGAAVLLLAAAAALALGGGWEALRLVLFAALLFFAFFGLPLPRLLRERRRLRAERMAGVPPPPPPPPAASREGWLRAVARRAPVTTGLAALLVGVQAVTWLLGEDQVHARFAKVNDRIWAGEWWRLLTAPFLHAGPLHLAFNALALLSFGSLVEDLYGWRKLLLLYLASGLAGSVASLVFTPAPSVGASGALFGLLGVLLVFGLRHREALAPAVRGRFTREIALCIGINVTLGVLARFVDNFAHLGGLVAGALLALVVSPGPRVRAALAGRAPPG